MNRPFRIRFMPGVGATVIAAGVAGAGPVMQIEEPQPVEFHIGRPTLSLEVENDSLRTSRSDGSLVPTKDETLDVTPTVGLLFDGSIYDPRLLQFNLETDLGFTKGKRWVDDGTGQTVTSDRNFFLQRYNATATMLREKPYSLTLFGTKDRVQRDYDQFNRFNADVNNYGAAIRNIGGNWNSDLRLSHNDETIDSSSLPSIYREDLLNVNLQNRRSPDDFTTLRFDNRNFWRQDGGTQPYNGVERTFYALDEESFSTNRENRLESSLTASDIDESISDTSAITWREDFRHQIRENLWSGAIYEYDRREADTGRFQEHRAEVYAEHKLYENLVSRLNLHGERDTDLDDSETRYGPGLDEHYTRRLSDFGRISLSFDGYIDHIIPRSNGASIGTVIGEPVHFEDQRPAFLTRPNVRTADIVVTDDSRVRRYLEGADYRIVQHGSFTEIQRVFGGAIPNGSTVRVDYPAEAIPSSSLNQMNRSAAGELDLFERRAVLYAQQQVSESFGGSSPQFQNYMDTVIGAKSHWSWFEVGAEHVNHTADELSYSGIDYYAELFWEAEYFSAKLHADRSLIDYGQQGGEQDTTTYTATLNWNPGQLMTLQGFAGQYYETLNDGKRDIFTLAGNVIFHYSRLSFVLTYRYEDEQDSVDRFERHYLLAKLTRYF